MIDIKKEIPTIYVGYDPREDIAFQVLKYSVLKHASQPINVYPIKQDQLRRIGLYRRAWELGSSSLPKAINDDDTQHRDIFDGRPFATDFSFTRFLIPFLNRLEGWALYMDCDMFFRSDPIELFNNFSEEKYAIYCAQHNYQTSETVKMYGNQQYQYSRKFWSSLVFYNCSHDGHKNFSVDDVNTKPGRWLHNFLWLEDQDIGKLPEEWNWLDGYSPIKLSPKNVHFTRGGPWFRDHAWKPLRDQDKVYSKEWLELKKEMESSIK
tara:strand:- start:1036 stop:1830 length:795 start_codon:yes stop_codon:yes gene_type:complete